MIAVLALAPNDDKMEDDQPKAKYLVLKHAIPAAFKDRLLGCVVNEVIDPANGLQPDFRLTEENIAQTLIDPAASTTSSPPPLSDYERLKSVMKDFLMENVDADPQDKKKFKNQVNLQDLLTERRVEGDVSVEGSLTKILKAHYSSKDKRNFEIVAATGKRYHLHNAVFEFKKRLWSNGYYRESIYEVIEQKRDDGTLETLNKVSKKYGAKKAPRHKCEVVILPMVVGILTCEEIKVNIVDGRERAHGGGVTVPVDELAGTETNGMLDVAANYEAKNTAENRTAETIPDEVIVAVAYDLIAISTGKADPDDTGNQHSPDNRSFWGKFQFLGFGNSHAVCTACEENKLPYAAAWRHTAIRTNSSRGANIHMSHSTNHSGINTPTSSVGKELEPEDEVDLATVPIELYIAPHSDHYVLAEQLDPRLFPSGTGSTTRSYESRHSGIVVENVDEQTGEMGMNGHAT